MFCCHLFVATVQGSRHESSARQQFSRQSRSGSPGDFEETWHPQAR